MIKKALVISIVATGCTPVAVSERAPDAVSRNATGLSFIEATAANMESAANAYFSCLTFQMAVQKVGARNGYTSMGLAEQIDAAIASCRPTARHYATKIMEEKTDFDRRFYAQNIRQAVLPDIEEIAKTRLTELSG